MLSKKSPGKNIGVRGNFAKKILDELGFSAKVIATGCPSLFISSDINLGSVIQEKFHSSSREYKSSRMAITAGNPHKRESAAIERSLIDIVNDLCAMYIIQNPQTLINLASGWRSDDESKYLDIIQKIWMPGLEKDHIRGWFLKNGKVCISVPQWIYGLSKIEFCAGTRIHGVQAAIQAGTPAVCICIDSRTRELCDFMRIPSINIGSLSEGRSIIDQLFEAFEKWDGAEFDRNRLTLARRTRAFLRQNELNPPDHLMALKK